MVGRKGEQRPNNIRIIASFRYRQIIIPFRSSKEKVTTNQYLQFFNLHLAPSSEPGDDSDVYSRYKLWNS